MEGKPSQPPGIGRHSAKPVPLFAVWASLTALILVISLACNLPVRQSAGLVFVTDRPAADSSPRLTSTGAVSLAPTEISTTSTPIAPGFEAPANPFLGLHIATPGLPAVSPSLTPELMGSSQPFIYRTQSGDTLSALASRFGVDPGQITPPQPSIGLLAAGVQLVIPNQLGQPPYSSAVLPDSAVINSPAVASFQAAEYIDRAGGYLSVYSEEVDGETLSGAEIVQRVSLESSISPRLLLAVLEFRSGWVRGQPYRYTQPEYPIGFYVPEYEGLYLELSLVVKQLSLGYYGWRQGSLTDLSFADGSQVRLSPGLNAGSVAVQLLTSLFYRQQSDWSEALYGSRGLLAVYTAMFGDPWLAAAGFEPLFPAGLAQPTLELPFAPGEYWSLTSGPHLSWRTGSPRGALDFAPITGEPPCAVSRVWVTASAPGLVVRAGQGVLALDLDGDGFEQTGWVLVYMHIAEQDRLPVGAWVDVNAPIGHPSCEGGTATGTNVHLARKYNGEWIGADGPLPMVLSGWVAHQGDLSYSGTLEKDGQVVTSRPDGSSGSTIIR
jgi:LasA protease